MLLQSASLLGGIIGDVAMRAAALLPPVDIAVKDFNLTYPVSLCTPRHCLHASCVCVRQPTAPILHGSNICATAILQKVLQVRGKWPCQVKVQSLSGSSRVVAGGIFSSFEQAAGSLLLDGTTIADFDAVKPTCRTVISRCAAVVKRCSNRTWDETSSGIVCNMTAGAIKVVPDKL